MSDMNKYDYLCAGCFVNDKCPNKTKADVCLLNNLNRQKHENTMQKIYKYPISMGESQILNLPLINVLTVQMQNGIPCLWAIIDETRPPRSIEILCLCTGYSLGPSILSNAIYISTIQTSGLVFHYFYKYL